MYLLEITVGTLKETNEGMTCFSYTIYSTIMTVAQGCSWVKGYGKCATWVAMNVLLVNCTNLKAHHSQVNHTKARLYHK